MLILDDVLLAKHCFKEADVLISSTIANKRFTITVPATFRNGEFDDKMLQEVKKMVEKWCTENCEQELYGLDQFVEYLKCFK